MINTQSSKQSNECCTHVAHWKLGLVIQHCLLLKTGSLDDEIQQFPLAEPPWYMSHYTMFYKYGKGVHNFFFGGGEGGVYIFIVLYFLEGVFNKTLLFHSCLDMR